ncbi:sialate:O-sulfotransferase 1-like isoform X2 [Patella vulgata]|uniref:sialate:O-sulfotransferase 1-like isoform X2 n=1 Tax=Patella vulgata TaxID=6465 RepID=UPI0024A8E186|nr:sialate:O-sulfotransferase 1-like isoform X2 [Patella vulgata]
MYHTLYLIIQLNRETQANTLSSNYSTYHTHMAVFRTLLTKRRSNRTLAIAGLILLICCIYSVYKLHPRSVTSYSNIIEKPKNCPKLGFAKTPLPVTALASYPGSGNSWTRHLLQKSTGIYTGSRSREGFMIKNGYVGEGVTNGSVIVIKTHGTKRDWIAYERAVLLMRNQFEAQWSFFNLKMSGSHTNITDKKRYCTNYGILNRSDRWKKFYINWLQFKGDMFVLFYDELLQNKENKLRELLRFLGFSTKNIDCALYDPEGIAHRVDKFPFRFYDKDYINTTNSNIEEVAKELRKRSPVMADHVLTWRKSPSEAMEKYQFDEFCKEYAKERTKMLNLKLYARHEIVEQKRN